MVTLRCSAGPERAFGVNLMANTSILGFGIPLSPVTWIFASASPLPSSPRWLSRERRPRGITYCPVTWCGPGPRPSSAVGSAASAGDDLPVHRPPERRRAVHDPVHRPRGCCGCASRAGRYAAAWCSPRWWSTRASSTRSCFSSPRSHWASPPAYLPPGRSSGGPGVAARVRIAVLAAGAVLAYPLWFQFAGPQAYHGLPQPVLALSSGPSPRSRSSASVRSSATRPGSPGSATSPSRTRSSAGRCSCCWSRRQSRSGGSGSRGRRHHRCPSSGCSRSARRCAMTAGRPRGAHPGSWLSKLPLFDSVVPTGLGTGGAHRWWACCWRYWSTGTSRCTRPHRSRSSPHPHRRRRRGGGCRCDCCGRPRSVWPLCR